MKHTLLNESQWKYTETKHPVKTQWLVEKNREVEDWGSWEWSEGQGGNGKVEGCTKVGMKRLIKE